MRKTALIIISILFCSFCTKRQMLEEIFENICKSESDKYLVPIGIENEFREFLFMRNKDSVSYKFKYSLKKDTIYIVDIVSEEGNMVYSIWNKYDTISNSHFGKPSKKIQVSPKLIKMIEKWDTNGIKQKSIPNSMRRYYGFPTYYSAIIIINNNNYEIQTLKHKYYP